MSIGSTIWNTASAFGHGTKKVLGGAASTAARAVGLGGNNEETKQNGQQTVAVGDAEANLLKKTVTHPFGNGATIEKFGAWDILKWAGRKISNIGSGALGLASGAKNLVMGHPKTALIGGAAALGAYELSKEGKKHDRTDTERSGQAHLAETDAHQLAPKERDHHLAVVNEQYKPTQRVNSTEKLNQEAKEKGNFSTHNVANITEARGHKNKANAVAEVAQTTEQALSGREIRSTLDATTANSLAQNSLQTGAQDTLRQDIGHEKGRGKVLSFPGQDASSARTTSRSETQEKPKGKLFTFPKENGRLAETSNVVDTGKGEVKIAA